MPSLKVMHPVYKGCYLILDIHPELVGLAVFLSVVNMHEVLVFAWQNNNISSMVTSWRDSINHVVPSADMPATLRRSYRGYGGTVAWTLSLFLPLSGLVLDVVDFILF